MIDTTTLYEQGFTIRQIARRTHTSAMKVYYQLEAAGVKMRQRGRPQVVRVPLGPRAVACLKRISPRLGPIDAALDLIEQVYYERTGESVVLTKRINRTQDAEPGEGI